MIKKHKVLSFMGMIAALFVCGGMLTGCGEMASKMASEMNSDAKYLLYKKEGDAVTGYYIRVFGLNVECDESGNLKVDLDELATKKQRKLEIPATIDGLPVKKVSLDIYALGKNLGGTVVRSGTVPIRAVTGSEVKYYLANPQKYYDYITEVVVPEGVEELQFYGFPLNNITLPANIKRCTVHASGKVVVPVSTFVDNSTSIRASELEVVATDDTSIEKRVSVYATKSAVLPNNIRNIDLSGIFLYKKIQEEYKGLKLTCLSYANIQLNEDLSDHFRTVEQLSYGDVIVNGKDLKEFLK